MTADLGLTQDLLHDAYRAAARAMSIRPEPVVRRSRDHASARARAIVWWVLTRTDHIPCHDVAHLSGFSQSNIRHAVALVSTMWSPNEERVKDRAISAVFKTLHPDMK